MILVDFSHLSMRNLYIAISQTKPKKINGVYENSYVNFFYHLMLNSLRHIQNKFKDEYGDIILAIDGKDNWRKKVYPDYKAHRKKDREKSSVDFEYFFNKREQFIKILDTCFPYYVIEIENTEADDIIGVLSKHSKSLNEKTLVITSDKDMKQVLEFGVDLYDPIKQEFIKMDPSEVKMYKELHILLGDSGDNIPNVMKGLEYDKDFISFLKKNNIYVTNPAKLEEMEIFDKLEEEYKNMFPEKPIYKKTRFGEKTALKFIKEDRYQEFKDNSKFLKNLERNKKLIDFNHIPLDIQTKILNAYKNREMKYNGDCIFKFIVKANLREMMNNINEFLL